MKMGSAPTTASVQALNWGQTLCEAADDLLFEYDATLGCCAMNAIGTVLWGLPIDAIVGRPQAEVEAAVTVAAQAVISEVHQQVQQAIATAKRALVVHAFPTVTGTRFYEIAYTPVPDPRDRVQRVFGIGREVTQDCYHRSQTAQRPPAQYPPGPTLARSRFPAGTDMLDRLPQCIFWKDLNSVYLGCNQSWATLVGLAHPQEIIGKTETDLLWAADEIQDYIDCDQQVMLTGEAQLHILTSRLKANGEQHWFDAIKVPLRDESGQIVGVLCAFENLSEQRRRAKELSKSIELLQLVLDNIPQAIFWKDRNSVYLGCNKNWAAAAGITDLEEVVGKTDFELFWTPEEAQLYCEQDRQVMETNTPVMHLIEHRQQADGKNAWIDVNKIPIHDAEGNVIGVLGTIEDITDRKQVELALLESEQQLRQQTLQLEAALEELRQTQSQLVQTEKMSSLGQMVAGIAHEINNPVNFIHGNLNYAREYTQDLLNLLRLYQEHYPQPVPAIQHESAAIDLDFLLRDLPKLLTSMRVGTERIQKIVLSLRTFSRIDEAEMKAVDIHEGIDSTLLILQSRLKNQADQGGIQILKDYGDLPAVECYAGQLNQVFLNILANAIDALEEKTQKRYACSASKGLPTHLPGTAIAEDPSTICIGTKVLPDDRIAIWIRDNGIGMTETVRQRLFDPFFTTKPVGQGTGLGLSISYQIITDRHNGSIRCHSQPGQGSEFWIEIPIQQ